MELRGKVLIIVENLPVPFDRRVWQEATELTKNRYQVCVICPRSEQYNEEYELIDGIHIYRHPLPIEAEGIIGYAVEYSSALIWETFLAWKVLLKHGFDVIHACNPPDTIFIIGLMFKLLFQKKFIFDHHDINPELYLAKFNHKDVFYHFLRLFEWLTFRVADRTIATNESYRKIAIERNGMKPEDVYIVRSGPDLERLRIIPKNNKWKKGKKFLVGYVGVMGKQEGIDYLLQAIKYIVEEMDRGDIHFCIVGGGTELSNLKLLSRKLEISDYITFTGRISDQELLEVLNTADICVNPDIANEMNDKSTMNKIMEYMALGKPIVQFDLTEGRYSAQKSSLYARPNDSKDFADKILFLIENPDIRSKMGALGRERVINELAWKYEAPKLIDVYKSILN